jgi:hypothetical protein
MKRKGVIYTIALTVFSVLVLGSSAFAATLTVDTDNATWEETTVSIPLVYAAGEDSVSSFNCSITWDDSRYALSTCVVGVAGSSASKQIDFNQTSATTAKVIVYGVNSTALQDGTVAQLTLSILETAADGDSSVTVTDQVAASPSATEVALSVTNGTLSLDRTAPTVVITAPTDGATFGRTEISVEGTVDDTSITSVSVNGNDVAVTDGAFSTTITLAEGENTITVTAVDSQANGSSESVTVSYTIGDVDEDGVVDSTDVASAKDQVIGVSAYGVTADINGDGVISVVDLQSIINRTL